MTENFVLLTESDYNNYLKLKEQQTKYNFYHKTINKSKYYILKESNPEQFKLLMQRQNEYNKRYRQNILNLKQSDPQKYEQLETLKIQKQTTKLLNKLKEQKQNQVLNEETEQFNNIIIAT
jgi:hypothetical protein